jgi:hypothetical protein
VRGNQREKRKTVHQEMSGELSRSHGREGNDRKEGLKKDTSFFARGKIRIRRRRIGVGGRNNFMNLLDIFRLYLATFGLIVFGHQSDDEGVLELFVIEDRAVLKFVDFIRTK